MVSLWSMWFSLALCSSEVWGDGKSYSERNNAESLRFVLWDKTCYDISLPLAHSAHHLLWARTFLMYLTILQSCWYMFELCLRKLLEIEIFSTFKTTCQNICTTWRRKQKSHWGALRLGLTISWSLIGSEVCVSTVCIAAVNGQWSVCKNEWSLKLQLQ